MISYCLDQYFYSKKKYKIELCLIHVFYRLLVINGPNHVTVFVILADE